MLPGARKRVFNFHDILMYIAVARKHLRLMVLLMCFSWLAGLVYYVYARPVYYSRALIRANAVKQTISAEGEFKEPQYLHAVIKELTSPHIIKNTAAKLGVNGSHADIMKYYIKMVRARRNSEQNIEVEVWPYSHDWSRRWTQTMLQEYETYTQQRRMAEMKERMDTYNTQREEAMKMLLAAHQRLAEARAGVQSSEATIRFEQLKNLYTDIAEVGKKLDEVGRVRIEILDPSMSTIEKLSRISSVLDKQEIGTGRVGPPAGDDKSQPVNLQLITPTLSNASTSWHSLDRDLHGLELQKSSKDYVNLLEGHPKMKALQAEIDAVKAKLEAELGTSINALTVEFNKLIDKKNHLNGQRKDFEKAQKDWYLDKQKDEIANATLNPIKNLLEKLDRDMDRARIAFDNDKIELSFGGMQQINDLPVSPNRFMLFLYTTALGLMMVVGIPFLLEYLDHTLSNLEQVESTFQLRGLGIVPKVDNADTSVALLDSQEAKEQNLLENFRVIRTNLLSMGALSSKPPHVLMITSAMPKEGKTVVSSNLALSFAQTGAKTLLMDTDLRRGRLHRFFSYRKTPGLSTVLLGQCSLDEAIRPTPRENLFIISAGQYLETGTELLGSKAFHDLMTELKKRFDRIILDTPPVLGLSETSVLQNQVDGVLFVIWSGYTPIKGVKAAIEMLQANGANFYGFVLNRLDLSATANYYQYYYYSHDYYYQYTPRSLENV